MIYGPEELFHWPKRNESVDKSTGVWGIWLPGFCQLGTGLCLMYLAFATGLNFSLGMTLPLKGRLQHWLQ